MPARTWLVLALLMVVVGALGLLPAAASYSADRLAIPRPAMLPLPAAPPAPRGQPLVSADVIDASLRLPQFDAAVADLHGQAALRAYQAGQYRLAVEEAVLSLDPTPIGRNRLGQAIASVEFGEFTGSAVVGGKLVDPRILKPGGRRALPGIDAALRDLPSPQDAGQSLGQRLTNLSATMIGLYASGDTATGPEFMWAAREVAYQAIERAPPTCAALLNLTLLDGPDHNLFRFREQPATAWTAYTSGTACAEPALGYHLAQNAVRRLSIEICSTRWPLADVAAPLAEMERYAARLERDPAWAGVAASVRGDAYLWAALRYSTGDMPDQPGWGARPYSARTFYSRAAEEYRVALALQPDDAGLRHGLAVAALGLDDLQAAQAEASAAAEAAPGVPLLVATHTAVLRAAGDHATAASYERAALLNPRPLPRRAPVSFPAVSFGAGRLGQLSLWGGEQCGAGGAFYEDDGIIAAPRRPPYLPHEGSELGGGRRDQNDDVRARRWYAVLLDDLLAGRYDDLRADAARVPSANDWRVAYAPLLDAATLLASPALARPGGRTATFYQEVADLLRGARRYADAMRVLQAWEGALGPASPGQRAELARQIGELRYLDGDLAGARLDFERALRLAPDWPPYLLRAALVHERTDDLDAAAALYRRTLGLARGSPPPRPPAPLRYGDLPCMEAEKPLDLESFFPVTYQAAKHLGDLALRRGAYADAAVRYREALSLPQCGLVAVDATFLANNLGLSLLMAGDHNAATALLTQLVQPAASTLGEGRRQTARGPDGAPVVTVTEPPFSVTPDEHNPVYRMNLGWVAKQAGNLDEAAAQTLAALRADPSLYPAANDLGVLAAQAGRVDEARRYFRVALDAKPDYPYALHNLGVALLHGGPREFLAAQAYLARAARVRSSLRDAGTDYLFDDEIYAIRRDATAPVPSGWSFARNAERSAQALSLLAVLLLALQGVYAFGVAFVQDSAFTRAYGDAGRVGRATRRSLGRLRRLAVMLRRGPSLADRSWTTPVSLVVAAVALAMVLDWPPLVDRSRGALVAAGALGAIALVSVFVHYAGHELASAQTRLAVEDRPWPAGILAAVGLAATGYTLAVMSITHVRLPAGAPTATRAFVHLAGPVASALLALALYGWFLVAGTPLLRSAAIINLAIASSSLLPLPGLDGAMLGKGRAGRIASGLALAVGIVLALVAARIV